MKLLVRLSARTELLFSLPRTLLLLGEALPDMYVSLTVLTATTIASITAPGITYSSSLTAVSLPAGTVIEGDIRAVTISSGLSILYKA
jgi:hypothetical protein